MYLSVVPALPFLGFIILLLFGGKMNRTFVSLTGVGSIMLACVAMIYFAVQYFWLTSDFHAFREIEWTWIPFYSSKLEGTTIQLAFFLDSLSMLMMGIITFVGSLIALFSVKYMDHEDGIVRYFAVMNLFIAAMLILVLADNFLLLFLGWEGVGVCSFLLIGFWYEDQTTGKAAMKAFITTRIGDVFLLFALFLLFQEFGTLSFQEVFEMSKGHWMVGSPIVTIVCFCLLGGAVGKSAQIPLHTWLPDAMKGPTPVSALIHAATMVTAGVYLIARTGSLFALAPLAQNAVLIIGAATLVIAGLSAVVQTDMKRVLAYSTISQIGYMFLALGAGAYTAAMFHLTIHAFFKALLFLSAGAIGYSMHHNHDMLKMGNLKKRLPVVFWVFLAGSSCLAALPLVTAGFYSKEFILGQVFASPIAGLWPWVIGVFGAFITGLYSFRMLYISFFGVKKVKLTSIRPDWKMYVPLCVLATFALVAGFVQTPVLLGDISFFADFVGESVLPDVTILEETSTEWFLLISASLLSLSGILLAYILYFKKRIQNNNSVSANPLHQFVFAGFGFDQLYGLIVVKPFLFISKLCRRDLIQVLCRWISDLVILIARILTCGQTGHLRHYIFVLACGAVVITLIMVLS
ncbi:MAG: NADH-quinone oxidoreductase subunit L [bacterium]|nr:NADH-quinone oxidoreductase subunit L [bacterium]